MLLVALTDGSVSGEFSVDLPHRVLGALLITADGTNAAVITVQRTNNQGKEVFSISTKTPMFVAGPISLEGATIAYCSVTGTGAAVQLYAWIN